MYLQSDGSYDILSSSKSTTLIPLTDTKGKAWSSATPVGIKTSDAGSGYSLVTQSVSKKGVSSYLEYDV